MDGCLIIQGMVWTVTAYQGSTRAKQTAGVWRCHQVMGEEKMWDWILYLPWEPITTHTNPYIIRHPSMAWHSYWTACALKMGLTSCPKSLQLPTNARHCTTSRKVAGLIPDGVIGFFHSHIPSSHTMALGSTQPLTKMSTRNISWGV